MRIGAALNRVVAGETRKGLALERRPVFGMGCSPRKDHGLPAFRTSGLVLYTKVALSSSKSEHGTLTGGVLWSRCPT